MSHRNQLLKTALLLCLTSAGIAAQEENTKSQPEERIAWYGTLEAGLEEAKRLDLPVLIMSAAPQCSTVPGMW